MTEDMEMGHALWTSLTTVTSNPGSDMETGWEANARVSLWQSGLVLFGGYRFLY